MKYSFTLLLIFFLFLVGSSCHRKGPTESTGRVSLLTVYYPLAVDNWWLTEQRVWENGDTTIDTVKLEIVEREIVSRDGVCYLGVEQPSGDSIWFLISEDELRIHSDSPVDTSSYTLPLELPLDIGARWIFSHPPGEDTLFAEVTSKTSDINVPAGNFDTCLRVDIKYRSGEVCFAQWFAPGVGPVRSCNGNTDSGWHYELLDYHVAEVDIDGGFR